MMVDELKASDFKVTKIGAYAIIISMLVLVALSAISLPIAQDSKALNISFSLSEERFNVTVQKDGSVDIHYLFSFTNVDYLNGVDIGMPNSYYDASSASARIFVDGTEHAAQSIGPSPYVNPGMAVEFSGSTITAIIAARSFQLDFTVNAPHMVYRNVLANDSVGVKFRPTWFDPSYQVGSTGLLVTNIIFPQGFSNVSQAMWLESNPWDSIELNSTIAKVVATWTRSSVDPSAQAGGSYDVGAAFPTAFVDQYFEPVVPPGPNVLGDLIDLLLTLAPILFMALIFAVIIVSGISKSRKLASDYFEPKMDVIGAGPRRDLTAVEAAIILERPIEMVATMILFALTKKDLVRVVSEEQPMRLDRLSTKGEYPYETSYLEAINPDGTVDRSRLKQAMVALVRNTSDKMNGFDLVATKGYYERICDTAWQQVHQAGTPEEFANALKEKNDWMMLEPDYERRMNRTIILVPPIVLGPGGRGPVGTRLPGQGRENIASDYVNKLKNTSNNLVKDMRGLTKEVAPISNPIPVVPAGQRQSGGTGSHCACACACAGGGR